MLTNKKFKDFFSKKIAKLETLKPHFEVRL